MDDDFPHTALTEMPAVSRALARGDAAAAYEAILRFAEQGQAGRILLELSKTEPGWEKKVREWGDEVGRQERGLDSVPPSELGTELGERERQILEAAARGLGNTETGVELFLSRNTIMSHRRRIIAKMGARNMTHAVHLAHERGLL